MNRSHRQLASTVLVVAMLLALASPATAASPGERAAPQCALVRIHQFFNWIGESWTDWMPQSLVAASGGGMDPDGAPQSSSPSSSGPENSAPQSGGGMDPDG